ncbi:ParB/RepB/Spo0J family partition protein [Persicobacter psychrovividus]|uniref:ParB-like N-terminal domain-containing protein n=1 Tax=Persicobacter psychrovividus TaxID=387638 RepID=A0ABM7VLM0_9BACT|nr:hypothetical protein PEPS_41470 [Persicobacter psychrovividus]
MAKKQIKSSRGGKRGRAIQPHDVSTKDVQSTEISAEVTRVQDFAIKSEIETHMVGRDAYLSAIAFTSFDDPLIKVQPELKALIPALTKNEYQKLTESVQKEGVREPVLVWQDPDGGFYYIVDGHNRWRVAGALKLMEIPYRVLQFADLEAVKEYMVDLQMGKRNLVKWQVSYFRGMKYERLKGNHGGDRSAQEGGRLAENLGASFGVSAMTIQRDAKFYRGVQALPEDVKARFLDRKISAKKAEIEKIGAFNTFEKIGALDIVRIFELEQENASEDDILWYDQLSVQVKPVVKAKTTFDLHKYMKSEESRIRKVLKSADQEGKALLLAHYQKLISEIEQA